MNVEQLINELTAEIANLEKQAADAQFQIKIKKAKLRKLEGLAEKIKDVYEQLPPAV